MWSSAAWRKIPRSVGRGAGDLTSELKWIAEAGGAISATTAGAEAAGLRSIATGRRREQLAWVACFFFFVAAIVSTVYYLRLIQTPAPTIISEILPPEKTQFSFDPYVGGRPVLSPDGSAVAFFATDASGKRMLWIRSFDSLAARPLAGTDGGNS